MNKIWKKLTIIVLVSCCMLFGFLFSACSDAEEEEQDAKTVTLNYHFAELSLFDTFQLKIEENEVVEWSSENNVIASVDENGLVTANGYGETKIIAKSGDISDSCTISVLNEGLVPSIQTNVDDNQLSMILGDQFLLNCVVFYNESQFNDATFTYTSSDESVVSVDGITGKLVAKAYGNTSISVKASWRGFDDIYLTESVSVTVVPNVSMSVSATETELDTVSGEIDGITYDNQAKIQFSISLDGVESTDSVEYAWEYSKENIVSVDNDGNLTAQGKGEVDVVLACTVGNEVYRSLPIRFVVSNPKKMMTEVLAYALDCDEPFTIEGLDGMPTEIRIGDIDFTANATFSEGSVTLDSINHDFPCGSSTLYVDTTIYSYEYTIYFATHVIENKEDFLSYMNGWSGGASAATNGTLDDYVVLTEDINLGGENVALKISSDYFSGTFNGLGHTVTNMKYQPKQIGAAWTIVGIFGRVDKAGVIENVALTGITSSDGANSYILSDYMCGAVKNVYVQATVNNLKNVIRLGWSNNGWGTVSNCVVNISYAGTTSNSLFNDSDNKGAANASKVQNTYAIGNGASFSPWSDETRTVYADGYTLLSENKTDLATWDGYWSLRGDTFYFGDTVVAMMGTQNDTLYTAATELTLTDLTDGIEIVSLTVNGASVQVPTNGKLSLTEFVYGTANELLIITANGTAITQPIVTASHVISSAAEFMAYMNSWSGGSTATTNGTSDDYVVLTKDINLGGENVALKTQADYFAGKFNGLGHTVTNMKYQPKQIGSAWTIVGIFGRVNKAGVIENVAFTGITSSDGANSYILSDYMCGSVKNVYVQATVNNLKNVVRVAWGNNAWGTVSNCIVNIKYNNATSNSLFNDADGNGAANATAVKNTYAIGNAAKFSPWSNETRTVYADVETFLTAEKANITTANNWSEYWTFDESGNLYFGATKVA